MKVIQNLNNVKCGAIKKSGAEIATDVGSNIIKGVSAACFLKGVKDGKVFNPDITNLDVAGIGAFIGILCSTVNVAKEYFFNS